MNCIMRNGLFQRLALAALAAAALACAVLWDAARAPEASAQELRLGATLESCGADADAGNRIVDGQPLALSAEVAVGNASIVSRWKVHFEVESDRGVFNAFDYDEEFETDTLRISPGRSGTFERRISDLSEGTYTLECVLYADAAWPRGGERARRETEFTVHPAQPPVAPEPMDNHGDDRASATHISVDSGASGVINAWNDKDYFWFQASRGREYAIETRPVSGSRVDTVISLYASDGSRLGSDNGGGGAASLAWRALSTGVYYVEVDGRGARTGGYRLSVSAVALGPGKLQVAPIGGLTAYLNNQQQTAGDWSVHYTLTNRVSNGESLDGKRP